MPPDLPLAERLDRFVHQRALLLEAVTPIRRAADVHGPFSPEITARLRDGQAFLRAELVRTFEPELDAAGPDRDDVLDCLDSALSWATWEGLRHGLGRDQPTAERVVRRLAERALDLIAAATSAARLLREAQQALADDVLLHLGGAAGDAAAGRAEHAGGRRRRRAWRRRRPGRPRARRRRTSAP